MFDYSSHCISFQKGRTRENFLLYYLTKVNEKYESLFIHNLMKSVINEKLLLCPILNNSSLLGSSSLNFLRIGTHRCNLPCDCYGGGIFIRKVFSEMVMTRSVLKTTAVAKHVISLTLTINVWFFYNSTADRSGMLFIGDAVIQVSLFYTLDSSMTLF